MIVATNMFWFILGIFSRSSLAVRSSSICHRRINILSEQYLYGCRRKIHSSFIRQAGRKPYVLSTKLVLVTPPPAFTIATPNE